MKIHNMSSKKYEISQIGKRIIELSTMYSSAKEFLIKCEIPNQSLITDIKKGRAKSTGAEYLGKIVRGTGCSGTWLLTGEGEMFMSSRNRENPASAEPQVQYLATLIDRLERSGGIDSKELPPGFELSVARLLVELLELRDRDSS